MDRRQEKTLNEIYKAFTSLLLTEPYTKLSVRNIIEKANVGRTTFYAHFSAKDELLENFCAYLFEYVISKADKSIRAYGAPNDVKTKTYFLVESFGKNYNNILDLITGPNGDIVIKFFKDVNKKYIRKHLRLDRYERESKADNDFLVNYVSSTFFESLRWWIDHGMKDSPKTVTDRFHGIVDPVVINKLESENYEQKVVDVDTAYRMERKGDSSKDVRILNYLNALDILSQSTDDFLFLTDISQDMYWFFGPVDKDYSLRKPGSDTNTFAEIMNIVYPADKPNVQKCYNAIIEGTTDVFNVDCRWINRRGDAVWVNSRAKVISDEEGKPFVMIGRVSEEAMRHLYNSITGFFNKVKMREDLKNSFTTLNKGYLILVDLDDLAAINLSHGRDYGDLLIKELASIIESHPSVDRVYHTELSYFAAWLNVEDEQGVRRVFNDIQESLGQKCTITAGAVPLDGSLYIDYTNLYDSAKIILRKTKNNNKSNVDFFSPEDMKRSIYSVELIEELHESTANGFEGFKVNYQPQVKAGSYDIFSLEALMRYHSPTRGPVYPDEFIPLLEKTGLINPVGIWILEEALTQCKKWRKSIPDLRISVNFSTVQFKDEYIVDKIISALNKTGMPGNALTIEITESIPLHEADRFGNIIKRLKQEGIQIAIDDFGTGYSNIGYLKKLDIDEIKIDRMFVTNIEEDTYNYKLISNTMEFAKMNEIRICCEGVETSKELVVLENLSPDILQGYLFDKPCEVKEFEEAYINKGSEKYKTRQKFIRQLYEYKEKLGVIHFDPTDILRETNVGLWIIRYNNAKDNHELYVDETMEKILGLDKIYTAQETYDFWFSRIADEDKDYVSHNINTMAELDKVVQLQYSWNHPTLGTVELRSTGKRTGDVDGMIVLEGYHRILSNIEEV